MAMFVSHLPVRNASTQYFIENNENLREAGLTTLLNTVFMVSLSLDLRLTFFLGLNPARPTIHPVNSMGALRACDIRATLGLSSSSSDSQWSRMQNDAKEILRRRDILSRSGMAPNEVKAVKVAATKELENMYPAIFRHISSLNIRQSVLYDILTLVTTNERLRCRGAQANQFTDIDKIVVTITAPSLSIPSSQLLWADLVVDDNISIDKLYEVLREDGLQCGPGSKFVIQDEYSCSLSSGRHLQAAFQRVANEGRLITKWVVLPAKLGIPSPPADPPVLAKPPEVPHPSSKTVPASMGSPSSSRAVPSIPVLGKRTRTEIDNDSTLANPHLPYSTYFQRSEAGRDLPQKQAVVTSDLESSEVGFMPYSNLRRSTRLGSTQESRGRNDSYPLGHQPYKKPVTQMRPSMYRLPPIKKRR